MTVVKVSVLVEMRKCSYTTVYNVSFSINILHRMRELVMIPVV